MNLAEMQAGLDAALAQARRELPGIDDLQALGELQRTMLGKRSPGAIAKEAIKDLDPSDRPAAGQVLGEYSATIAGLFVARREALQAAATLGGPLLDLTLGGHGRRRGRLHLVTQVRRELEDIFVGLGYHVAEGPEVEDDWHNFEALNIPQAHPARSMQDTLYVNLGRDEQVMLRTHTSPVQIRTLEAQDPPIYVVAPGRTYRNETLDATLAMSPAFARLAGVVASEVDAAFLVAVATLALGVALGVATA